MRLHQRVGGVCDVAGGAAGAEQLAGGARFIRDWDAERLYDPDRLRAASRWGRVPYIEHRDYGIRLQHEFPMDERRQHVLPGWAGHIQAARVRTMHLMDKFDRLGRPGRQVLFVRELMPGEERRAALIADLRRAVLERTRQDSGVFLLISRNGVEVEGWTPLRIDDPVEEPWTGTPAIWDAALSGLGLSFERQPKQVK